MLLLQEKLGQSDLKTGHKSELTVQGLPSVWAAEVAQCALDQGNEQFWQMHDWLYTQAVQGRTSQTEMIQAGANLGLDVSQLTDCVESGRHGETVRFDLQRGMDLGIRGTPTFFVNGRRVHNPSLMPQMIEEEIARAQG